MPEQQQNSSLLKIATAVPVLGPLIGAIAQGSQNRKNWRRTKQMYEIQRKDALADWNMQNQYNHPSAQMARLRDAGLNPNLVYGNGATATASQGVRSSSVNEMTQRAPDWSQAGGMAQMALAQMYDIQLKEAQTDNLRADNTVKQMQAELMSTDKLKKLLEIKTGNLDYDIKSSLKDYQIQYADLQNKRLMADTQVMLDRNEREIAMNNVSVKKAGEEILNYRLQREYTKLQMAKTVEETRQINKQILKIQQEIGNLNTDREIKFKDLEWRREGITPNDPAWYRGLKNILDKIKGRK